MLDCIDALEKANEQLVVAFKQCLKVLAQVEDLVPDQQGWKETLNEFQKIISVG